MNKDFLCESVPKDNLGVVPQGPSTLFFFGDRVSHWLDAHQASELPGSVRSSFSSDELPGLAFFNLE